jgi:DNA polymerase-1
MRLLLDANNAAYRANATTDLTTKQGERVSAIYGMLQMIQSYLKPSEGKYTNKLLDSLRIVQGDDELLFNEVVCAWDAGRSKQRMDIFPDYKGSRDAKKATQSEEEKQAYLQFIDQMNQLHAILPTFGVKSLKIPKWEGDDLVYVVTQMANDDVNVIVSTDKDMLQLVSDKVYVWSPFKEALITPKNFTTIVGVPQSQYMTYRILNGDSSDNIPGVHGIGDVKAKKLLSQYGSLDGIKAARADLMKSKVFSRIFDDNYSLLNRNDKLMNLSHVDYKAIASEVADVLSRETKFDAKEVKNFLAAKQFVSILADFLMWSMMFRLLGKQDDE